MYMHARCHTHTQAVREGKRQKDLKQNRFSSSSTHDSIPIAIHMALFHGADAHK